MKEVILFHMCHRSPENMASLLFPPLLVALCLWGHLWCAGWAVMSLLDLSQPWVHHGAPDLAQRAVSTLGDSSTSRLKHYRALQINRESICARKEKTQQQEESLLSVECRERRKDSYNAVWRSGEEEAVGSEWGRIVKERETKGRYQGEEGRQKVKGSLWERYGLFGWCLFPAFLRHPDQLWQLSLVINSFRFNYPSLSLCFTGGAYKYLICLGDAPCILFVWE